MADSVLIWNPWKSCHDVKAIRGLHDGAEAEVRVGGEVAEAFETTNGLKQVQFV